MQICKMQRLPNFGNVEVAQWSFLMVHDRRYFGYEQIIALKSVLLPSTLYVMSFVHFLSGSDFLSKVEYANFLQNCFEVILAHWK